MPEKQLLSELSLETIGGILALAMTLGLLVGRRLKTWMTPLAGVATNLFNKLVDTEFRQPMQVLKAENAELKAALQIEAARREAQHADHDFRLRVLESTSKETAAELAQIRRELERGRRNDEMHAEKLSEICEIVAGQKAMQSAQADSAELLSGQLQNLTKLIIEMRR